MKKTSYEINFTYMDMELTHRVRSGLLYSALLLIFGVCGMVFWYLRPESTSAHAGTVMFTGGGALLLIYTLYRLNKYKTNPTLITQDEKPFSDERWLVVQDKAMAFTGASAMLTLFFFSYFSDNICYFVFDVTDRLFVQTFQAMIAGVMGIIFLAFFISLIYYYYTRV